MSKSKCIQSHAEIVRQLIGIRETDYFPSGKHIFGYLYESGSCILFINVNRASDDDVKITIVSGFITIVGSFLLVGVVSSAAFRMILQNVFMLVSTKKKVGIWTHVSPVYLMRIGRLV